MHMFYKAVIIAVLGVYLYYLVYRALYTINPDALTFSLVYYYAELHGFVAMALYFFQLWNPTKRKSPPVPQGLSVDVYIPTYDENPSLLRKTVLSCMCMKYPHKVYILDDGHRPELAEMAKELGCFYIARDDRRHAKAGNMNHALAHTDGDFIATFDADYVPQPDFLEKTLGYFADEKVAFVQTPHNYYNTDSFQFWVNPEKKDKWNEQDVFYRLMMPGRDYWNASFFAGTSAVIRRKALDSIGGFATDTITEDLQTSMHLYKKGWKGVYHNEILSSGLAAKDLKSYHIQKLRWAEGNISLLKTENPLWIKGLTIPQRICFFATVFGWFIGFPQMIYFVTPAIMVLTGWYPIAPFDWPFIWRYLIFLSVIILGFKIVSRGHGKIRFDQIYNMMNFFVLIRAVGRTALKKAVYVVTPKGQGEAVKDIRALVPNLAVALLCIAGATWVALKLYYGVSEEVLGLGIGVFWVSMNGLLAIAVIHKTTAPYHKRKDFRFVGATPIQYKTATEEGIGVSRDLNEYGVSLVTFAPLPIGESLSLSLHLGPRVLQCKGTVLYYDPNHTQSTALGKLFNYGVRFENITQDERDMISQFCFNQVLPEFLQKFDHKESFMMRLVFWYYNRRRIQKRAPRKEMAFPLQVQNNGKALYTVTHDVSASGLSFTSHFCFNAGDQVGIEIYTPRETIQADAEIRYCHEIASDRLHYIGARFVDQARAGEAFARLTEKPAIVKLARQKVA